MLPVMNDNIFFSGQFLLATPGMADPRFARSVVAICSHDENGALGINIGETVEGISFHDVLKQFEIDPGDEMLSAIAQGRGPAKWIIALGYSGWGEGQLEAELTQNGWSIAEGSPDWLYETGSADKWSMAWEAQGIDPTKLSSGFGSA